MIYAITPENRAFVPLLRRAAVSDTARHLRKGKRLEGIRAPLDLRNGSIRRRRGNLYPCGRRGSGHCRLPALPNDAATHAFERFPQLVEGEVPEASYILGRSRIFSVRDSDSGVYYELGAAMHEFCFARGITSCTAV